MTQRIRFQLSGFSIDEENDNLKKLLENFIVRSEELEKKESRVMQQVEMLQSALTTLQAYNKDRGTKSPEKTVHLNLEEIEEETRRIKEETDRIRREVREKIEENKKLQDEIDKRKAEETGTVDEFVTESYIKNMEAETERIERAREKYKEPVKTVESMEKKLKIDPGMQFFIEKLRKLEEMEKKVKKESEEETKERKKKRKEMREKIDMLEWESEVDRQLISSLKKKFTRN